MPGAVADEETPLLARAPAHGGGGTATPPRRDSRESLDQTRKRDWLANGEGTSGVFNLCSATLGAGQLQIPFAFVQAGIIPGILLLLLGAVCTFFSFRYIVLCAAEKGATSLEQVARQAFGKRVQGALQIGIVLFSIGIACMFMTRAGDLLEAALVGTMSRERALCIYGVLCFVMASAKQMYTIRTISICSLLSVLYLVGLTVGHSVWHLATESSLPYHIHETPHSELLFGTFWGACTTFPMVFYAFAAQLSVPAILEGMNQEYKLKKRLRRLVLKRKRIARALAFTRAQSGVLDELIAGGATLATQGLTTPPGGSPIINGTGDLSDVPFKKLERLNTMPLGALARTPLETLSSSQFRALQNESRVTLSRHQIRILSALPLESLSPVELQALGELPLEDFSVIMLNYAATNPIEALEADQNILDGMSLRRQIMERRQQRWEETSGALRLEEHFKPENASRGIMPSSPGAKLGMSRGMKMKSFDAVSAMAVLACTLVDLLVGVFGALEFGENTQENILRNFALHLDIGSVWLFLAYGSFLFHISTVLPLILFPARATLLGIAFGPNEAALAADLEQRMVAGSLRDVEQEKAGRRLFKFHRASELVTLALVAVCVIITSKSEAHIKTTFELLRGYGFAFMCFGFPAVAAIKMDLVQDSKLDIFGSWFLIIVSIVATGFWTYAAIEDDFFHRTS